MRGAHPKLPLNEMMGIYPDCELGAMARFCANYVRRRKAVGYYAGLPEAEAEIGVTQVFYGTRPTAELPFLTKIRTLCGDTGIYL